MSTGARWTIAIFSLFCAVGFAYVAFAMPGASEPRGIVGQILVFLFPLFCLAITVSCFSGPLRNIAARFLGGCVFALSIGYIISEIGKPIPNLAEYQRSDTNIINAIRFFIVFGLPAAYVLFKGHFPKDEASEDEENREGGEDFENEDELEN